MPDGPVLLTGGTGTLGRALVQQLRAAGPEPRVLSRRPGPGRVVGDLDTGVGLDEAVRDVAVVVHAATRPGHDVAATRRLVDAVERVGARPHLVYVSIVGVDRVPLGYYRDKLAVEGLVAASGLPWTVQRATQFHDLVDRVLRYASLLPVLPVLAGTSFQPIDVRDVAARLVELTATGPAGRVPDLGGPEVVAMAELARSWLTAAGKRRSVRSVRVPGKLFGAYREGGHLVPEHAEGRISFAEFLAARGE